MFLSNVTSFLDFSKIPVSRIEKDLGMGAGTLGKFIAGKRELPKKWKEPLSSYIEKNGSSIPPLSPKVPEIGLDKWSKEFEKNPAQAGIPVVFHTTSKGEDSWKAISRHELEVGERLLQFCAQNKVSIEDFFVWLDENYGKEPDKVRKATKNQSEAKTEGAQFGRPNFQDQLWKKKLGIKPESE